MSFLISAVASHAPSADHIYKACNSHHTVETQEFMRTLHVVNQLTLQ